VYAWLGFAVLAAVCGSIPTGLLLARARGVDIRRHGSGNIGATNVGRVMGARLGLLCFAIDFAKGFGPTLAAGLVMGVAGSGAPAPADAWAWLAVMGLTILGHMYSPWIGFRGGKGVATGLGALLAVYPYLTVPALAGALVWAVLLAAFRYMGVAAASAAAMMPLLVIAWAYGRARWILALPSDGWPAYRAVWTPFVVVAIALAAVVVFKHRGNIRRTVAGTEFKFGRRIDPTAPAPPAPPGAP
jgi:glycerol-3-phosphate acyltransferase PlsY